MWTFIALSLTVQEIQNYFHEKSFAHHCTLLITTTRYFILRNFKHLHAFNTYSATMTSCTIDYIELPFPFKSLFTSKFSNTASWMSSKIFPYIYECLTDDVAIKFSIMRHYCDIHLRFIMIFYRTDLVNIMPNSRMCITWLFKVLWLWHIYLLCIFSEIIIKLRKN